MRADNSSQHQLSSQTGASFARHSVRPQTSESCKTICIVFTAAEDTLSSDDAGKLTSWMEKHLGRKIKCCKVSELLGNDHLRSAEGLVA